jgi:hypothetical protein
MKNLTRLSLAIAVACAASSAHAVTYYVRADGGTTTQCTGRSDAAYDGAGSAEACAWNHPSLGLGGMAGSDTLIIKNGSYSVSSAMAVPPSGTSTAPTRILGEQYAACRRKPELWGTGGRSRVIDLSGRSWIEVACLEITDHDNCINGHYALDCVAGDSYAIDGVYAYNSSNIVLRDLNVHGLVNGFRGGKVHNLTLDRVRLAANGDAGFHGATSNTDDSFTGTILLRRVEIAWNGCGENYPTLRIHGCYGQPGGGYGDGLGTADTAGVWIIEDSYIHHNTSDGLDLRYTKLAGADVIIRRSWFYNNAGNQVKVWGKLLMENSFASSYCTYFGARYDTVSDGTTDPTPCRASGNTVFIVAPNMTGTGITLRYNTITGESSQLVQFNEEAGAGSNSVARLENNVLIGAPQYNNPNTPAKLVGNVPGISVQYYNNHIFNVAGGTCPSGSACTNPQLRNQSITAFDPRPASGSPVLGAGNTSYTTPATDITGRTRPTAPARGAFEYSP